MMLLWIAVGFIGFAVVAFIFVSRRDGALRRSGVLPAVGQATMADVERLVRAGERVAAIRVYREVQQVGLAEAKKAVEELHIGG